MTAARLVTRRCPLCRRTPDPPTDPTRHPLVARHGAMCPVAVAAHRQDRADAAELATRPAGAVLTRPLTSVERIAVGALAGGRPIPARLARETHVHRVALAPRLLLTAVVYRGRCRSVEVVDVEPD